MSHIISFRTKVRDRASIVATCQRLGMPAPKDVTNYRLRNGRRVSGVSVELPDWTNRVVFDLGSGVVEFDNWSPYDATHAEVRAGRKQVGEDGRWGDISELNRFTDEYLATEMMFEAQQQGHIVSDYRWNEESQSVTLTINT